MYLLRIWIFFTIPISLSFAETISAEGAVAANSASSKVAANAGLAVASAVIQLSASSAGSSTVEIDAMPVVEPKVSYSFTSPSKLVSVDQNSVVPPQFVFIPSGSGFGAYWVSALIAGGISLIGLILQAVFYWLNRRNQKIDAENSRDQDLFDEYWLRKILFPMIQEKIKSFVKKQDKYWKALTKEKCSLSSDYLENDFQAGLHEIITMLDLLLSATDSNSRDPMDRVIISIEKLEENVVSQYIFYCEECDENQLKYIAKEARRYLSSFEYRFSLAFMKAHEHIVLNKINS